MSTNNPTQQGISIGGIITIAVIIVGIIAGFMFGLPKYSIWKKEQKGRAALAEATFERQIIVEEAEARKAAAALNAEAEVITAEGLAKAMALENDQLDDTYVRYLFVKGLNLAIREGNMPDQIIYVPSNSVLPTMDVSKGATGKSPPPNVSTSLAEVTD